MLDGNDHVFTLCAARYRRGHFAGEQRILGIIFKVPPAQGVAVQVGRRRIPNVRAELCGGFADCHAHLLGEAVVISAGNDRFRREGDALL